MLFGLFSGVALAVNLLLLVAVLSMLQATLTLPGMAAMALVLGMAIDSNVLINERVREELRNGASAQAAIHAGYDRAWATILDSNVTTLIAGLALLAFGSGPVRGFAVVHCIGILTIDVLRRVLLARPGQSLVWPEEEAQDGVDRDGLASAGRSGYNQGRVRKNGQNGILQDPPRHPVHGECVDLQRDLLPDLSAAVFFLTTRGLHLSVEFTGGTRDGGELFADRPTSKTSARPCRQLGFADVQVQNFGTSRDVLIRLPAQKGVSSAQQSEKVLAALKADNPAVALRRTEFVGPQVGDELATDGLKALAMVVAGIMIYLALRFEWKFAVAAIIANLHDVVIILGFFAFFQWEFSLRGAGRRAGRAGLFGERVGGDFRPDPREFPALSQDEHGADHRQRHHLHHQPHHHHPRLAPRSWCCPCCCSAARRCTTLPWR